MAQNNDYVWVVRDRLKSCVSVCKSKATAQKQMRLLAIETAKLYNTSIKKECEKSITLENMDEVDIIELPFRNTLKSFARYCGFELKK